MVTVVRCDLGGRELTIETGKLAKQAGGSVVVRSGDTAVLVVATAAKDPKKDVDFLPLTVEYLEKTFAAGKIPGGFFKREGRPSENAVLTSRFIDRPIRPLFPENYHYETQVIAIVLSASPHDNPDTFAIIGASAALSISDIPLVKPIAGCRVGRVNGQFVINPSLEQMEESDLDMVLAASEDSVVMVEGGALELSEDVLLEAIQFGHAALKPVIAIQKELQAKIGKPKRVIAEAVKDARIAQTVASCESRVREALAVKVKQDRYTMLDAIKTELKTRFFAETEPTAAQTLQFADEFGNLKSRLMRAGILDESRRIDGRGLKDIRQISCETGFLPRTHGSALFTRGETQALVVVTLGSADDEQSIDGLLLETSKRFMLNYNFPGFSVGEVKPLRSPGRREIGHGHLAERALLAMIPDEKTFPYTIRIVSEILESNGSSSMATVCGAALSMMDAGVPIKAPVAGIAMGLVKEDSKVAILSDILGDEDHLGDMDFKVTGTRNGVTALQMDIKIEGVTTEIMKQALVQAREGRFHILDKMAEALAAPRAELSQHAPKIETMEIPQKKIGEVIGPGGKMIKQIIEETGVKIDIDDDGLVKIFSTDVEAIEQAKSIIREIIAEIEIGKIYNGTVNRIVDFGAFVGITPKIDGLVHISQIADRRINKVTDVLHEGDRVMVKVLEIERGKVRLTMRGVDQGQQSPTATRVS